MGKNIYTLIFYVCTYVPNFKALLPLIFFFVKDRLKLVEKGNFIYA